MNPSPLELHYYYTSELSFSVNKDFKSKGSILPGDNLQIEVDVRDLKDDSQPQWLVTLIVRQHASEDQPYAFSVELEGYFSIFSSRFDEAGSEKLLRTNGAAILYGVAREMIRSLTAHGPYMPAFLPSVGFRPSEPEASPTNTEAPAR
jgi:preprotein translocase subunit SecB